MTYSELKASVVAWFAYPSPEFINQLDTFIEFAEKEAARILRMKATEAQVKLVFNPNNRRQCHAPDDYLESKTMFLSNSNEVIRKISLTELLNKTSGLDKTEDNADRWYAIMGQDFVFHPDIPEDEEVYFVYSRDPNNMSKENDTTVILSTAPELMQYLTMKQACVYLNDEAGAVRYNELAQGVVNQIREQMDRMDTRPNTHVVPKRRR